MNDTNHKHNIEKLLCKINETLSDVVKKEDLEKFSKLLGSVLRDNEVLKQEVAELKRTTEQLKGKMNAMEAEARRKNLVIYGLAKEDEPYKEAAKKFINDKLGVSNDFEIERAFPLGKVSPGKRRPPVLVQLKDEETIPELLKISAKMRSTEFAVKRDMPKQARINVARFRRLKWEIANKHTKQQLHMKLSYDQLIINGLPFQWIGENLHCKGQDGIKALKDITGADWSYTVDAILRPSTPVSSTPVSCKTPKKSVKKRLR